MECFSVKKDDVNTSQKSSKIGLFLIAITGSLFYIINFVSISCTKLFLYLFVHH